MTKARLSPSILTADFSNLSTTFRLLESSPDVGFIHFDVMDGDFVPNINFGAQIIHSLERKTTLPFDVHLMVSEPGRFVETFVTDITEYITVHAEATIHLDRTLRQIKDLGVKCGVALNPATPPDALDYVFDIVDQILVMSVNPGFGGQSFIPSSLEKIKKLASLRLERELDFKIGVDGGVTMDNLLDVCYAGADIIIVGSAILNAKDPESELIAFGDLLKTAYA